MKIIDKSYLPKIECDLVLGKISQLNYNFKTRKAPLTQVSYKKEHKLGEYRRNKLLLLMEG